MNASFRFRRMFLYFALSLATLLWMAPNVAMAGTTGTITGTVRDGASGTPIANVKVTASSPTGTQSTVTNGTGFYSLQALIPDTYSVSFQVPGFEPASQAGIFVQQDQISVVDQRMNRALKEIGSVRAQSSSNLVKGYTGTDVYNLNGSQLNAASGGDNLHKTLYEYTATIPGLAPIGGGFPAEPSIHGGQDTDNELRDVVKPV